MVKNACSNQAGLPQTQMACVEVTKQGVACGIRMLIKDLSVYVTRQYARSRRSAFAAFLLMCNCRYNRRVDVVNCYGRYGTACDQERALYCGEESEHDKATFRWSKRAVRYSLNELGYCAGCQGENAA